jgi:hypothetical protein
VELVHWADDVYAELGENLDSTQRTILELLKNRQIKPLVAFLEKHKYTDIQNITYSLILSEIQKNLPSIIDQWGFRDTFKEKDDFVNLFLENNIFAFKKDTHLKSSNIFLNENVDLELQEELLNENLIQNPQYNTQFLINPQYICIGGEIYTVSGLNSIENLQNVLKESNIQQEFQKYYKYDKIAQFIDSLEIDLQKLFSLHQIGLIIYQDAIYLIKWVQFLDEYQLITGTKRRQDDIMLLEDFGVKIGLELKSDLTFGNLVVFKSDSGHSSTNQGQLEPLISLTSNLLNQEIEKMYRKYNLNRREDCVQFVEDVNTRIEAGILLLTKKNEKLRQTAKNIDTYIRISLERVDNMESVNHRLNLLREISNLNKKPALAKIINEKMELNYIFYLKKQFSLGNFAQIPHLMKSIADLQIFMPDPTLLIHSIVFLFEKYYVKSQIIISTVDIILEKWQISDKMLRLLEKPQVTALSNEIIQMIENRKIKQILPFLKSYLKDHPQFHSIHILVLILKILKDIYKIRQHSQKIHFTNGDFLDFFNEFLIISSVYRQNFAPAEQKSFQTSFTNTLQSIAIDLDFIGFIDDKIVTFLTIIRNLDSNQLSKKQLYLIVRSFAEYSPLVMFRSKKPSICKTLFLFLKDNYQDLSLVALFIEKYIEIFSKSQKIIEDSPNFFGSATTLFTHIKEWIDQTATLSKIHLLPIKRGITVFLNQWYLSGQMPEQGYTNHKQIIEDWISFATMQEKLDTMLSLVTIKDLAWVAKKSDLMLFKEKYQQIPQNLFQNYHLHLIKNLSSILNQSSKGLEHFRMGNQIFQYFKDDYKKFCLTPTIMNEIISSYEIFCLNGLKYTIKSGLETLFQQILQKIAPEFLIFDKSFFTNLKSILIQIYHTNLQEGKVFTHRLTMINTMSIQIQMVIDSYDSISDGISPTLLSFREIRKVSFLQNIISEISQYKYDLFESAQSWLIQISNKEYITKEEVIKPISALFQIIIESEEFDQNEIEQEFIVLIEQFFKNQKMLNSNKKIFFNMMEDLFPIKKFPDFYPKLNDYNKFIEELVDVETLYFSLRNRDPSKAKKVLDRCNKLISKYPHLFTPWYYSANSLIILGKNEKAIEAFKEALKYNTSQSNISRLYYNLLVAYLSQNRIKKAVEIVDSLAVGIKTFPYIIEIMEKIEELKSENLEAI